MTLYKIGETWFDRLLPEGILTNTSTIISGPGGSGKPLVELAFVRSWLKNGGSVLGIPLQYPSLAMVKASMMKLYQLDMDDYSSRAAYIQFNPGIEGIRQSGEHSLEANMMIPEVWDMAIEKGKSLVEKSSMGVLVFGSALNLLLFSPAHKQAILKHMENIVRDDKSLTYLFTISNNVFTEDIKHLEQAADNLMFTHLEKPKKLYLRIERMNGVAFSREEIAVPIAPELLDEISSIAQETRQRRVKDIMHKPK